jgi:hypothetical protein
MFSGAPPEKITTGVLRACRALQISPGVREAWVLFAVSPHRAGADMQSWHMRLHQSSGSTCNAASFRNPRDERMVQGVGKLL